MSEKTMLPWRAKIDEDSQYLDGIMSRMAVTNDAGHIIAYCFDEKHVGLIVRAVNSHDDTLAALKALVAQVLDYERVNNFAPSPGRKYCWDVTERAVAAIAKAEPQKSDIRTI